jgi:Zn-dependent protease with chaperone function
MLTSLLNMSAPSAQNFVLRNPEAFFKAQKRNRRATWRMSALCVFAAIIMGIPLTLVLTPLLYGITLIAADIINRFSPLPPEFWQTIDGLSKLFVRVADYLINQRGSVDPQELAIGLALTLLPGMVFAFVLWVGMQMLFRHGGVGGTLASLGARDPNPSDLKELQLSDVVQEMAIAAGLPAPKLMLIDSGGANAAAIGTSPHDARIVISRRLLDDLDRDQLQAILAAQVASIGNGDLSIAFTVTSVFEACGMIVTLINSPFGSQSRSTLWRVIRYAFKGKSQDRAADAAEVAGMLTDTLDVDSTDINKFFEGQNPGLIKKFIRLLFFPMMFTNVAVEITLWFFLNVCLGPCMALLWRTRRYLGDAGAVELTRNPDALARALQRLSEDNNAMEGAEWASHLFAVNPKGDISLSGLQPSPEKMAETIAAWKATGSAAGTGENAAVATPAAFPGEWPAIRKEMLSVGMAAATGDTKAALRMQAFALAMGGDPGMGLPAMPNLNDLALAQKGDREAIARIRAFKEERKATGRARHGQSGLQTHSFLSFHPPLAKRAKRLQKMGSTLVAPGRGYGVGTTILMVVLYAIVGPLLAAAGVMMLVAIAIMIGLNLMFLTLWLTIIHWAFGQNWVANYNGFVKFVNDFIAAINRARR